MDPMRERRSAPPSPVRAHACFRLDARVPLDISAAPEVRDLWRRLSYRVIREPGDLLAHTRRVLLCRRRELREFLPGALLDLDHAVGDRAVALRARLLAATRHRLAPTRVAWFEARLAGTAGAAPACPGRVLPTLARARRLASAAEATAS